ncbi:MAG: hypothetical protein C0483_17180 [Pirellula sp.]|nr:hypothetical protein [Pirellula sp.]
MATAPSRPPLTSDMNLPLMHRVAETLMSFDAKAYRAIDVAASGSIVTLQGRVVGVEAHRQAVSLARSTSGVTEVVDLLRVTAARGSSVDLPLVRIEPGHSQSTSAAQQVDELHPQPRRNLAIAGLLSVIVLASASSLWALGVVKFGEEEKVIVAPPRPRVVPAEGSILYEGRPAAGARLVFHPYGDYRAVPQRSFAVADYEGRFHVSTFGSGDGAVPGNYVVTVDWIPPCPPGGDPEKYSDLGNVAPKRFQNLDSTPLRIKVVDTNAVVKLPPLNMSRGYGAGDVRQLLP